MGFFSDILGTVAGVAGSFLGVQQAPVARAPAALAPLALAPVARLVEPPPAGIFAKVAPGGRPLISPEQAQRVLGASGRMRKRTTVETFDPVTGVVSKTLTFAGGVAVRSADITAFKRVFRQITKISAKLPRKTIKPSDIKFLTDRVVKNALEHAGDPHNNGECPK